MPQNKPILVPLLGLLLLFLAHGMALIYQVQPAVSLWFPPAGVAVTLTLWLGPIGALLTAIASVTMAPFWGVDGWTRLVGIIDAIEPLIALFLYRRCFRGTLPLSGLNASIAFLLSAPLIASASLAVLGCAALLALGKMTDVNLGETIGIWWVGNAIGTMVIAPPALIFLTPVLQRWRWISLRRTEPVPEASFVPRFRRHWFEIVLLVASVLCTSLLAVHATQFNLFAAVQLSLLSAIPIIWAAIRFGVKGGTLTASFSVLITLLNYLLFYPQAISLPFFPVDAELLHTHKLSLLMQAAIGLVVGMAITERASTQATLAIEQVRLVEYQARAELSDNLLQLNRLLTETIQQLQETEAQLRDRQHFIHQVTDTVPGIIYVYDLIEQRNIYANRQIAVSLGYTPDVIRAMGSSLFLQLMHPEDLAQLPKQMEYIQTLQDGEIVEFEFRLRHTNGEWRWFNDRTTVFSRTADGKPSQMLGCAQDVTDRKQIEIALNQANERFRLAAAAVSCMIYDWDLQRNQVERTGGLTKLLGYSPEQIGSSAGWWWQQIHPEDQMKLPSTVEDTPIYEDCYSLEYRVQHQQGHYIYVQDQGIVLRDEQGKPIRIVGSTTDISERKRFEAERAQILAREQAARQQAEAASRMKDEFLAIVSHELRSPLNAILGWSRLLRTRRLDEEKTEQALESIERNAQAQTQLIEDLLDISRIIRGNIRLNIRPTRLVPVIQAALDTVCPTATTKSIYLETHLDPDVGMILADTDRLQQIVWNLLSNAVKFTPQGGRVEVRLEQVMGNGSSVMGDDKKEWEEREVSPSSPSFPSSPITHHPSPITDYAQIIVTDTGKGIAPDFLPYVFERFQQADATTTRNQGGLGLGLAIVRNLVELHGGRVFADSKGEGQGATFTVQMPLIKHPVDSPELDNLLPYRQTALEPSLSLTGLKILAVDDEPDTRDFLKTALEQYGATVTTAASASEALQRLQAVQPDILLSDIGMPVADGYSLIRQVRSLPEAQGGRIPAAALTAYAREGDRLEALNAGFQMHLPKPIEPVQLLIVVANLAGRLRDSVLH